MSSPSMRACESASFNLGVSTAPPLVSPYTRCAFVRPYAGRLPACPPHSPSAIPSVGRSVGHPERRIRGRYNLCVWFYHGHCHGQWKKGRERMGKGPSSKQDQAGRGDKNYQYRCLQVHNLGGSDGQKRKWKGTQTHK